MPTHGEIRQHAKKLADRVGYDYDAEREDSRVALLTRPGATREIPKAADDELDPIELTADVDAGVSDADGAATGGGCACM